MSDEIKEILAYFEEYVKITDMHDSEPMLNWKDLKIVLDYITNLQQENVRFREIICFNEDYKSRIDKAIKVLKHHDHEYTGAVYSALNILQGEDKE